MTGTKAIADPSSELDPAARWLEHYDAVERQRRALGAARLRLRPRRLTSRRRRRAVATLVAVLVLFAGAALAVLWR